MRKGRNIGCVLAADTSERRPLDARTVTAPLMRLLLSQFQAPPAPRRPFRFFRFGCPSGYAAGLIAQPTSDRPTWEARSVTDSSTSADDTECGMTTLRTASSMEFLCSFCGKRRGDAKDWLLGFEGTKEKSVVMKYTRDLIQGLADKIANGNYRQWLRLVLSDYDKPLSRVEEERVAFDRPDQRLADDVALTAVRECLEHLYKEIGRTPAAGEIEAKSQAVLAGIPDGQPWISTLSKRLRAVAKGIRNGQ